MTILTILVRLLEGMFVAGAIGSFVVLLLTGVEDLETLLGAKSKEPSKEAPAS
jgi:hypothetical protein